MDTARFPLLSPTNAKRTRMHWLLLVLVGCLWVSCASGASPVDAPITRRPTLAKKRKAVPPTNAIRLVEFRKDREKRGEAPDPSPTPVPSSMGEEPTSQLRRAQQELEERRRGVDRRRLLGTGGSPLRLPPTKPSLFRLNACACSTAQYCSGGTTCTACPTGSTSTGTAAAFCTCGAK